MKKAEYAQLIVRSRIASYILLLIVIGSSAISILSTENAKSQKSHEQLCFAAGDNNSVALALRPSGVSKEIRGIHYRLILGSSIQHKSQFLFHFLSNFIQSFPNTKLIISKDIACFLFLRVIRI